MASVLKPRPRCPLRAPDTDTAQPQECAAACRVPSLRQAQGPTWCRQRALVVSESFAGSDGMWVVGPWGSASVPYTVAGVVEATQGALRGCGPLTGSGTEVVPSVWAGRSRELRGQRRNAGSAAAGTRARFGAGHLGASLRHARDRGGRVGLCWSFPGASRTIMKCRRCGHRGVRAFRTRSLSLSKRREVRRVPSTSSGTVKSCGLGTVSGRVGSARAGGQGRGVGGVAGGRSSPGPPCSWSLGAAPHDWD